MLESASARSMTVASSSAASTRSPIAGSTAAGRSVRLIGARLSRLGRGRRRHARARAEGGGARWTGDHLLDRRRVVHDVKVLARGRVDLDHLRRYVAGIAGVVAQAWRDE